jgi:hypothetical protein
MTYDEIYKILAFEKTKIDYNKIIMKFKQASQVEYDSQLMTLVMKKQQEAFALENKNNIRNLHFRS